MMKKLIHIQLLLILIIGTSTAIGQSRSSELLTAYNNQDYSELESLFNKTRNTDLSSLEWTFYEALFTTDGEVAKNKFQQVFDESRGPLKKMAAKKIMDYYYAKGYYINASKYQKYLVDRDAEVIEEPAYPVTPQKSNEKKVVKTSNLPKSEYYIQVGAFSLQDNAEQLKKMLLTQDVNTIIVTREVNNKTLFCVWLPGKDDFERTLQYANTIKQKYELKFRIIKQ